MRQWTDLQRQEAAERTRLRRPWDFSTGPRSALGKLTSSRNSYKHGRFTHEKKFLRWYLRLAILRVKQLNTYLNYQNQKRENELRAKYGIPHPATPDRMAFYPYFRVHPLSGSQPKPRKQDFYADFPFK